MKSNLLQQINNPKDLRQLDEVQLPQVAQELRDFIIGVVAVKKEHSFDFYPLLLESKCFFRSNPVNLL